LELQNGAWIETFSVYDQRPTCSCRTSCGCVD